MVAKQEKCIKKYFFVAEIAFIHPGTKYIKRQLDIENFSKFRFTILLSNGCWMAEFCNFWCSRWPRYSFRCVDFLWSFLIGPRAALSSIQGSFSANMSFCRFYTISVFPSIYRIYSRSTWIICTDIKVFANYVWELIEALTEWKRLLGSWTRLGSKGSKREKVKVM